MPASASMPVSASMPASASCAKCEEWKKKVEVQEALISMLLRNSASKA